MSSEHLFVKKRKREGMRVVSTGEDRVANFVDKFKYDIFDIKNNSSQFDSKKSCEEDEWFFIDIQEDEKIVKPFLDAEESSSSFTQIEKKDFNEIEAFFFKEDNFDVIIFNRVFPRYYVKNKFIMKLNKKIEFEDLSDVVEVSCAVDALYDVKEKKLYFKSYNKIKLIFDGIESYYRIATEEEISRFKEFDILNIGDSCKIGDRNKKVIASVLDDDIMKNVKEQTDEYIKYAKKYNLQLLHENGRFQINKNKELTNFLNIATERYYTTEITHKEKFAKEVEDNG